MLHGVAMRFVKIAVSVLLSILSAFLIGCTASTSAVSEGLIISEVVTSNSNSVVDDVLGRPDWIELFNNSKEAINLKDYSIAESNSKKYVFPDVAVDAGGYLLVYCCSAPSAPTDKLCTGFKLSKSGVKLVLSSPHGAIQQLQVPALKPDISYGLTSDASFAFFAEPTPGAANTGKYAAEISGLESDISAGLVINEILPRGASSADPYGWVEILNGGQSAVELSDYYISEDPSDPVKARLPEKNLEPGAFAVVRFTGQKGPDQVPFKISKAENMLTIANNFGTVIDKLTWDPELYSGISVGRGDAGKPVYYLEPTPGAPNSPDAVPSAVLSEGTGDVRINEILLKNTYSAVDSDGDRSPWVELYNSSSKAVSLSGLALSDDKNVPMKWMFPDIQIDPGSYLVVFLSGKNRTAGAELHTGFKVGGTETELCLADLRSGKMQVIKLPSDRRDNISYGLSTDGQWLFFPQPTPSAANDTKGFATVPVNSDASPGLRINEVVSTHAVRSGSPDWVELHNESSDAISLSGYYLSDTKKNLKKWPLNNISVKAGGYAVIDSYKTEAGEKAELQISVSGETIYLSDSDAKIIDEYYTGALRPGFSSGLNAQGEKTVFRTPTKGSANGTDTVQGCCSEPVFSVPGGRQKGPVTLTMSTLTPGASIYYTTDGSVPTANSTKYTGPISVSSNKTIKAIARAPGKLDSSQMVATYLFDAPHTLPVVCLSIDSGDLRYVSASANRKDRRERPGYVEYYEADGKLGVRFPAGFRIAGAGTRLYNPRTFNLNLRGAYGQSSVSYPFFEGYEITTFKSLQLRHPGTGQDLTKIKDAYFHNIVNGMNIDNTQTRFVVVYINGSYWGLYEFKENQNADYLASKHGIDADKVVIVRGNKYDTKTGRTDKDIVNLYKLAQSNMNDPDVFAKYTKLADSDYFMDYLIAETFFDCYDTYNQKYAHTTDNTLKWRPLYYDFDLVLSSYSRNSFGIFFRDVYLRHAETSVAPAGETYMYLYNAFIKNDEWEKKFIERYAYVLNNILTTDKLLSVFDGMVESVKGEMPRTLAKWGGPSSMSVWNSKVKALMNNLQNRRKYVVKQLQNYFDLSDSRMKELFPNG